MFSNIGMLLMVLMMLGNHFMDNFFATGKMLESSLQSRHSWKREVSPCCFAWQFVNDSKHNLQWDFLDMVGSSKCNLENNSWRGETLNCTSLSFENVWHSDISDAKIMTTNEVMRCVLMCHVRQYIPIQNSINKDVGPLNWQNPIRWNFWPDKQPSFGFWLAALLIMSWGYIGHIHGINPCGAFSEVTADW